MPTNPKKQTADRTVKFSISMKESVAERAEKKAASQQRSLSSYVASLIARDTARMPASV